jgi:hypothetical protein
MMPLALIAAAAQAQPFTEIAGPFAPVFRSSTAWGDYDRDGDLDLLLTGLSNASDVSRIYRNDGAGSFTDIAAALLPVEAGTGQWVDFDSDGDLDVFLCGTLPGIASRIFRNDGAGAFTDVAAALPAVYQACADWGDVDNDGDLDLVLAGTDWASGEIARLYRNDGAGAFTALPLPVPGFRRGSLDLGDYDRDGDLDLLVSGLTTASQARADVYRNDGGTFVDAGAPLLDLYDGRAAWGDVDADGDLDVLLDGSDSSASHVFTRIYGNDAGAFVDAALGLPGAGEGSDLAWGDYDADGDLDFAAIAVDFGGSALLRNDGGAFAVVDAGLFSVCCGSIAWGDVDGDRDLDLVLTGLPSTTRLYRNAASAVNTPPSAPAGLAAAVLGHDVTLSWSPGFDGQTPAAGLTYNLRVGTAPGGVDVVPPMADPATGLRLVSAFGKVGPGLSWPLRGLADGTYFWSVQAIDNAFVGSPFAPEGTFTIGTPVAVGDPEIPSSALRVTHPLPNPMAGEGALGFALRAPALVTLEIFDPSGRKLAEPARGERGAGEHRVSWDARDLPSGVYLYRLTAGRAVVSGRTVVVSARR